MAVNSQNIKSSTFSLFSLTYYIDVLKGNRKFKFLLSVFIISILITIQTSALLIKELFPLTRNLEKNITKFVDDYYPSDLEVKIKDGTASTNVTEPYYVTLPQELLENPTAFTNDKFDKSSKVRILTIDTKGSAEDFESYQSMALLTKGNLVYYSDGNINIRSLRDVGDLTINKSKVMSEINKYTSKYNFQLIANVLILTIPFFLFMSVFFFQVIVYLFISIAVWIMLKVNLQKFSFGKIFIYTAAIAFIPTLIWNLITMIPGVTHFSFYLSNIPNIVVLGVAYIGILRLKKEIPSQVTPQIKPEEPVVAPAESETKEMEGKNVG